MAFFTGRMRGSVPAPLPDTSAAWSAADDDRFARVTADHRVGPEAAVEMRLTDLGTSKAEGVKADLEPRVVP